MSRSPKRFGTSEEARRHELGVATGLTNIVAQSGRWYVCEPGVNLTNAKWQLELVTVRTKKERKRWVATSVPVRPSAFDLPPLPIFRKFAALLSQRAVPLTKRQKSSVAWCERRIELDKRARTTGTFVQSAEPMMFYYNVRIPSGPREPGGPFTSETDFFVEDANHVRRASDGALCSVYGKEFRSKLLDTWAEPTTDIRFARLGRPELGVGLSDRERNVAVDIITGDPHVSTEGLRRAIDAFLEPAPGSLSA